MKPERKSKPVNGWAGKIDGKLDALPTTPRPFYSNCERPFKTRKQAEEVYDEVVRVEIREI